MEACVKVQFRGGVAPEGARVMLVRISQRLRAGLMNSAAPRLFAP